jgi:hypothetical protein
MKVPFERDLITDQMNTLGLSERAVIRATGIPNLTFRQARQEGELEGTLTLRHLQALADVLGLTLADLLAEPDAPPPTEPATTSAHDDAATLIPLLMQVPTLIAIDHLARTLNWDRLRTTAAVDAIPDALQHTGVRLHTSNGSIRLLPIVQTDKQLRATLGRIRSTNRPLNRIEANILTQVINHEHVLNRQPSNPVRVATGSLKNMGCIALDDNGVFALTDDLRLALPDL